MSARSIGRVAAQAVPWSLGFVILLAWARCGPDPGQTAPTSLTSSLEQTTDVRGPPPGERDGVHDYTDLRIVGAGDGWLVTWEDWGLARGARLAPDGTPLDPSPGLLLEQGGSLFSGDGSPAAPTAALPDTYFVIPGSRITLLGQTGDPVHPAPLPPLLSADAAVAGHGQAVVTQWSRIWSVSPTGELLWEAEGPTEEAVPVATAEGFLVGWSEAGRALVRSVAPTGTLGDVVVVADDGALRGLAAGPAGVLAWIGSTPPRLERLDEATGAPTGESTTEFGAGASLVALQEGWLLEAGARGWRIDPALEVTPVSLPFDAAWDDYAYDGSAELVQATSERGEPIRAGFVAEGAGAYAVVSRGIESLWARGVGGGPEGYLVIQESWELDAETRPAQAWRAGRDGRRIDETVLDLGEPASAGAPGRIEVSVAGDGAPWLVALGEADAVRLVEIGTSGGVVERGTLPCGPEDEGRPGTPVVPAVVRVEDGWFVACAGGGVRLYRLDNAFAPVGGGPQILAEAGADRQTSLAAATEGARVWVAWDEPETSWPATLAVAEIEADTGTVVDQRRLTRRGATRGLDVRGGRLAVGLEQGSFVKVLLLDGLQEPEPREVAESPGRASVMTAPVFVDDELWFCDSAAALLEGIEHEVVCLRVDWETATVAERLTVAGGWDGGFVGQATADEGDLVIAYTAPDADYGTLRGALTVLAAEQTNGDGGLTDAGDAEVPDGDAPDAGDGGGALPDAGDAGLDGGRPDAGDAGDGGSTVPDAGDAGDDGGALDAGAADGGDAGDGGVSDAGDGGAAGVPEDSGGCDGCAASGGDDLLALLALLGLRLAGGRHGRRGRRRTRRPAS